MIIKKVLSPIGPCLVSILPREGIAQWYQTFKTNVHVHFIFGN